MPSEVEQATCRVSDERRYIVIRCNDSQNHKILEHMLVEYCAGDVK